MNWIWLSLGMLGVLIVICAFVKLYLRKKLDDIDGLGHVTKKGSKQNIIAYFGDEELEDSGQ